MSANLTTASPANLTTESLTTISPIYPTIPGNMSNMDLAQIVELVFNQTHIDSPQLAKFLNDYDEYDHLIPGMFLVIFIAAIVILMFVVYYIGMSIMQCVGLSCCDCCGMKADRGENYSYQKLKQMSSAFEADDGTSEYSLVQF